MGLYQYDSTEDKLNLVAGSTNFSDAPVGAIFPFGGTDIPISFLLCDGSAVSRTDYEDLFKVIGTAFGTGDGSTTFNLPDLREATTKGAGLTGLSNNHCDVDGLALGEFINDRFQSHAHQTYVNGDPNYPFKVTNGTQGSSSGWSGGSQHNLIAMGVTSSSMRDGATTEVKAVGVNYIIKAKQIGMPTDFASAVGDIVVDKNTYSTSETIVGKWIDGKPIYRTVLSGTTNAGSSGETTITTRFANVIPNNYETIVSISGVIDTPISDGNVPRSLNFFSSTNDFVMCHVGSTINNVFYQGGFQIRTNNATHYSNSPFRAIIEYTKTT